MVSTKPIEYTNPLGSYQSTFEIGAPNGILLTVDVTATPFISFTDKAGLYTIVRGADPVIDDDLATKRYADSLIATPQYWNRDLINNHVFPLTVGDSVVVDPATFLAPAIPFGVPFLDTAVIHHGGDIRVNVENAFADATVLITNGAAGFAHLSLPGMVVTDCVRGYAAADQLYFLCLDTGGVLSGDGLLLDGTTTPILTFTPQNAITTFDFQAIVSTLNLYVSDILNLNPTDYTAIGAPAGGDVVVDDSLVTEERLGFYDGITTSWKWAVTGPAGLDKEIQFNDGGILGADTHFTFTKATHSLGIGIAIPTAKIQIESGAAAGQLKFTNTANVAGFRIGLTATGQVTINQAAADNLNIEVNGMQPMIILSSGYIGVGLGLTAITPTREFYVDSTNGMHLHPCVLPAGAIGDICMDVADSLLKYHDGVGWITPGVTIGGSDTHIQYNDGGILAGTAALVWNHTTNKLGINVPGGNPQNELHIDGVAGAAIIQLSNDITGRALTNGLQLSLSSAGNGALYNLANKDLAFGTNGAARITIKNDGKTGFGIAAPATNFHFDVGTGVDGGIQITNNATSGVTATSGLRIGVLGAAGFGYVKSESTTPLSFYFGTTEMVRIGYDGKVKIGDDLSGITIGATEEKLWLDDAGRDSTCIHFTNLDTGHNSATDGFVVGIKDTDSGRAWINQREAQDLEVWVNGNKRVVFASTGAVGINSATPVSLLDVNGSLGCGYLETAVDLPVAATDPYYTIVVTADGKTVTLPPAATVPRRIFVIKAMIAGAGPTSVTVEADGAEIFDKIAGLLNLTLIGTTGGAAVQNETVTVQSNSTGWTVISRTVDCHPGL